MIELPKDANGHVIPLDTKVLYDKEGKRMEVDWYTFYPDKDIWDVVFEDSCVRFSPRNLSLTKPDSLEELEEDLGKILNHPPKIVCAYFNRERKDCDGCRIENCEGSCSYACLEDIMTRIHELRGDN